ncbi:hypothetical protein B0A55_11540 [Friedmanniomyces simplex]|uniref:Uncharacterized protein n=1 Tax=Friedmanniomyces simplex TaxID=329884 RepID=A0A4U0W4R4_9PEZI|nr:hypothetical protein B0A55_11540 [Friedmanniomyces simplex]
MICTLSDENEPAPLLDAPLVEHNAEHYIRPIYVKILKVRGKTGWLLRRYDHFFGALKDDPQGLPHHGVQVGEYLVELTREKYLVGQRLTRGQIWESTIAHKIVGYTDLSDEDIQMESLKALDFVRRRRGGKYHVKHNNCETFTRELLRRVTTVSLDLSDSEASSLSETTILGPGEASLSILSMACCSSASFSEAKAEAKKGVEVTISELRDSTSERVDLWKTSQLVTTSVVSCYVDAIAAREGTQNTEAITQPSRPKAVVDGYAPNWDFNLFFVVNFAISSLVFYHQALFWPKWRLFSATCAVGCVMESGGYIGRLLLHNDPFSELGGKLDVILLTVAPAFLSAGLYFTLNTAMLAFGQHLSRMSPARCAYSFLICDMVSIILQGAGGAISAFATHKSLLNLGVNVMIAGLISQVVTLAVFLGLVIDYTVRCRRSIHDLNPGSLKLVNSTRFQLFAAAVATAFLCIFIRCCYRVAELWGGWGNDAMRQEASFIILDSDMCTLAALLMSVFHPQVFFKIPERVRLRDTSPKVELPRHTKVRSQGGVRPQMRVTFNPSLTEWEKDGVRSARNMPLT